MLNFSLLTDKSIIFFLVKYEKQSFTNDHPSFQTTFFSNFFFHSYNDCYNYCPIGISPTENSDRFSQGKPAATESRYPTYGACWVFGCFHNPPKSNMDYGIFNARTDVNACDCTRGCTDTVRESALKVDSGRKILCRIGESNQPQ